MGGQSRQRKIAPNSACKWVSRGPSTKGYLQKTKVFQLWQKGGRIGERELFLYFTINFLGEEYLRK